MSEDISRRDFLKLTATLGASVTLPKNILDKTESSSPEKVRNSLGREVKSRIETERSEFALTIDDGWSPNTTERMLDILKEKGYKADFFLVGLAAINCENKIPKLLSRLAQEGHTICYHTMTHEPLKDMEGRGASWFAKDYDQWIKTMKEILSEQEFEEAVEGKARAPYGAFTPAFLAMCKSKNLVPYGWASDPSTINRGQKIVRGDIALFHVREHDIEYLENIHDYTQGQLVPKTIDEVENQEQTPTHDRDIERLREKIM